MSVSFLNLTEFYTDCLTFHQAQKLGWVVLKLFYLHISPSIGGNMTEDFSNQHITLQPIGRISFTVDGIVSGGNCTDIVSTFIAQIVQRLRTAAVEL